MFISAHSHQKTISGMLTAIIKRKHDTIVFTQGSFSLLIGEMKLKNGLIQKAKEVKNTSCR